MDIGVLASRRMTATERVTKSANALGQEFGLGDLGDKVNVTGIKDLAVVQLYQLEAVADLLEAIGYAVAPNAFPALDVSPSAMELVKEHEVDLTKVEGTGAEGRILKSDVLEAIDVQAAEREEAERLQKIADAEANSTPAAIKYANEFGVDLTLITGTGANGKITLDDVKLAEVGQADTEPLE